MHIIGDIVNNVRFHLAMPTKDFLVIAIDKARDTLTVVSEDGAVHEFPASDCLINSGASDWAGCVTSIDNAYLLGSVVVRKEDDDSIPYIIIGGISSNHLTIVPLGGSLTLERVFRNKLELRKVTVND